MTEYTLRKIGEVFAVEKPKNILVFPQWTKHHSSNEIEHLKGISEAVKYVRDEANAIGASTEIVLPWFYKMELLEDKKDVDSATDSFDNPGILETYATNKEYQKYSIKILDSFGSNVLEDRVYDAGIIVPWCSCCRQDGNMNDSFDKHWPRIMGTLNSYTQNRAHVFIGSKTNLGEYYLKQKQRRLENCREIGLDPGCFLLENDLSSYLTNDSETKKES